MPKYTDIYEEEAATAYEEIKESLKPKDGFVHIIFLSSLHQIKLKLLCCDHKYTTQINYFLQRMQEDGYEILDVKHQEGTLIIYK